MTAIQYARQVSYIGRNGLGKQTGLFVQVSPGARASAIVSLSPLNTRGVANCTLNIPIEDIGAVIAALNRLKP